LYSEGRERYVRHSAGRDESCLCRSLICKRLGNVYYQFALLPAFFVMGLEHLHPAGCHVHRVAAENVSAIHLNVKTKPVSAEQAA